MKICICNECPLLFCGESDVECGLGCDVSELRLKQHGNKIWSDNCELDKIETINGTMIPYRCEDEIEETPKEEALKNETNLFSPFDYEAWNKMLYQRMISPSLWD